MNSELVQLKLNIESSVGDSTPTEAEYEDPLPLEEVGVLRLDKVKIISSNDIEKEYAFVFPVASNVANLSKWMCNLIIQAQWGYTDGETVRLLKYKIVYVLSFSAFYLPSQ